MANFHGNRRYWAIAATTLLLLTFGPTAQAQPEKDADPSRLTLDRLFASGEFRTESYGPVQWLSKQPGYSLLEPSAQVKGGQDIVRIDPATGKHTVLVSAGNLIPKGETSRWPSTVISGPPTRRWY